MSKTIGGHDNIYDLTLLDFVPKPVCDVETVHALETAVKRMGELLEKRRETVASPGLYTYIRAIDVLILRQVEIVKAIVSAGLIPP